MQHIKLILDKCGWDIKAACDILGTSKATIYRKIETYKLKKN
jgi:transcriptional regulator of acetoin/glycerol metabolism